MTDQKRSIPSIPTAPSDTPPLAPSSSSSPGVDTFEQQKDDIKSFSVDIPTNTPALSDDHKYRNAVGLTIAKEIEAYNHLRGVVAPGGSLQLLSDGAKPFYRISQDPAVNRAQIMRRIFEEIMGIHIMVTSLKDIVASLEQVQQKYALLVYDFPHGQQNIRENHSSKIFSVATSEARLCASMANLFSAKDPAFSSSSQHVPLLTAEERKRVTEFPIFKEEDLAGLVRPEVLEKLQHPGSKVSTTVVKHNPRLLIFVDKRKTSDSGAQKKKTSDQQKSQATTPAKSTPPQ